MKKIIFASLAAAVLMAVSCEEKQPKTYSITVAVDDSSMDSEVIRPDSYDVLVTNTATSTAVTAGTVNGVAVVSDLLPGIYTINVSSASVSGAKTYVISGSEQNISLLQDYSTTIAVRATKSSSLVFKEIYYAGAPGDGYYFRDQFYELYNQGPETVYADGLCISTLEFANYDFSIMYTYDIADQNKYVFCKTIWQIPGSGTEYPVKPGESIIVAQWATDHRAEKLSNGMSTVDLSGAEFEAIMGESTLWNGITITDGSAINMNKVVESGYASPQWLTSVSGAAYVIFNPSKPLENDNFIAVSNYTYGGNVREVLITDVIDAVQTGADETRATTLGLPVSLDAGFQHLDGYYNGKSISRKYVETRADGVRIYQDTNNTTNDFQINSTPSIRRDGVGVPSWNTWVK